MQTAAGTSGGDDLYRLRSRIAHDLRRVVKVITFERGSIAAEMKTGLVVRYVWDEAVIRRGEMTR